MSRLAPWVLLTLGWVWGCGRPPRDTVAPTAEIQAPADAAQANEPNLEFAPADWPMWRGAQADGVAVGPAVPSTWSETDNVVWRAEVPGRGHSSPIVLGDRVFLETANEQAKTQSVLAYDLKTGSVLWETELFRDGFESEMHSENTQATSTLATDGERLFASFLNDRSIWLVALDLEGTEQWRTNVGTFASKFGYSASPTLYRGLVLLAADHQQGGFLAALRRETGDVVWRRNRPAKSSYASPRVVRLGTEDQLVLCGCNLVSSFNPLTGAVNWETRGSAEAGVGTLVTTGDLLFASAGYPEQETLAVRPDGSVAWRNKTKSYCPSLLAHEGHVYQVADDGILRCYEAASGRETWKQRIGGRYRVSPVLSGDQILITDMQGRTTVFKADPEKYQQVAVNQLGEEGFASPAISAGRLLLRTASSGGGQRKETLYCIAGSEKPAP